MRCFYVLVHGRLTWAPELRTRTGPRQPPPPAGFYCHRYVLARNADEAREAAFRKVRNDLESKTGWIGQGGATLLLEAEEVAEAPAWKLLGPDDRGHTFYDEAE